MSIVPAGVIFSYSTFTSLLTASHRPTSQFHLESPDAVTPYALKGVPFTMVNGNAGERGDFLSGVRQL